MSCCRSRTAAEAHGHLSIHSEPSVPDVLYIVAIVGFFALMVGGIRLFERLVGNREHDTTRTAEQAPVQKSLRPQVTSKRPK
jgi:hypothetical protein